MSIIDKLEISDDAGETEEQPRDELHTPTPEPEEETPEPSPPEPEASDDDDEGATDDDTPAERKPRSRAQQRIEQEIERRKGLEDQLRRQEEQVRKMEERYNLLQERMTPKEPDPQAPDWEEDPAGWLKFNYEKLASQFEEQMERRQEHQQQAQQLIEVTQMEQGFAAREQAYAQQHPDYYDAVNHLRAQRMEFWKGLGMNTEQAGQKVYEENFSIVRAAAANGEDAAAAIYNLARSSGYAPNAKDGSDVERLKEKVQRSQSLGSRGSKTKVPSWNEISEMSDEEFEEFAGGDLKWKKLAGG